MKGGRDDGGEDAVEDGIDEYGGADGGDKGFRGT